MKVELSEALVEQLTERAEHLGALHRSRFTEWLSACVVEAPLLRN